MVAIDLVEMKDQELMSLLVTNDLGAWAEIVKRYGKLVYSISFQILKNNNDTEDAVQNTFVNLKIYASKFDGNQELKPWLARIASVEAIRIYNKKKYITKKESIRMETTNTSQQSQKRDAAEIMEQKEIEVMVKKAIDSLPEPTRVAVTLYFAGGMNQTEIAKELDLSQEVISRKIKTGLENVKNFLKRSGIHASITISPYLVQECLITSTPPKDFIQKLSQQLPTSAQIARATTKSVRKKVAGIPQNSQSTWLMTIMGFIAIAMIGYYYLFQNELIAPSLIPTNTMVKKEPEILNNSKVFLPIDYQKYAPVYFKMGKIQRELTNPEPSENVPIIHIGGNRNWSLKNNSSSENILYRNSFEKRGMDGFYIDTKFKQGYLFNGTINIESKNDRSGFMIITKLDSPEKHASKIGSKESIYDVDSRSGALGDVNTISNSEIEFFIFIWPNKNSWRSATFFKIKGSQSTQQFYQNSLDFTNQEFQIGFYSTGKTELLNFKYCELNNSFDPNNDSNFKEILSQFPKDFFHQP